MAKASDFLIAFDDGHGINTAGKRTPDGFRENVFNSKMIDYAVAAAKRCGFKTMLTAPGDADASLKSRTDKANKAGADAFVSGHYNAIDDEWRSGEGGIETFHYPGSASGKRLAQCIHKYLVKGTKLKDRGVKSANFHVLRETNMPAALPECGFMDIKKEAELMKSSAYQKECGEEIVQGLCEFFGVKFVAEKEEKKETPAKKSGSVKVQDDLYRVRKSANDAKTQKGAFTNLNSAKSMADDNYGYEVYLDGKLVYRPSVVYTVKKGDTLGEIAEKYKTTVKKLQDDNGIKKANLIYPGQKIKIK